MFLILYCVFRRGKKKEKKERELEEETEPLVPELPDYSLAKVIDRIDDLERLIKSPKENPLEKSASDILEYANRLEELLDVTRARHAELGLESVLELSGLTRGTHFNKTDDGYSIKVTPNHEYHIVTINCDKLIDDDMNGFAEDVNEIMCDGSTQSRVFLFPDYALAELLSFHPEYMTESHKNSVTLASPSTLLVMLNMIRIEWESREIISELGGVAHQMAEHVEAFTVLYNSLGRNIADSRNMYNKTVEEWHELQKSVGLAVKASGREQKDIPKI